MATPAVGVATRGRSLRPLRRGQSGGGGGGGGSGGGGSAGLRSGRGEAAEGSRCAGAAGGEPGTAVGRPVGWRWRSWGRPCPRRGGRAGPGPSRAARAGGAAQREQPVAAGDARAGPFLLGPFPRRRLSAPGACGGSALGARAAANRGFSPLASLLGSETLRHRRGSGIRRSAAGLGPPAGCRQRPPCHPARLGSAQHSRPLSRCRLPRAVPRRRALLLSTGSSTPRAGTLLVRASAVSCRSAALHRKPSDMHKHPSVVPSSRQCAAGDSFRSVFFLFVSLQSI